ATRTERSPLPNRPRHADGQPVPGQLAAGPARLGIAGARLSAGPRKALVRAVVGVARLERQARTDRRVLRPPRRLAVVRPKQTWRPGVPITRLEIRPHRPMRRGAVGAVRERLLPEDQIETLSADRARRRALDLHGPARKAAAGAGVGIRHRAG